MVGRKHHYYIVAADVEMIKSKTESFDPGQGLLWR